MDKAPDAFRTISEVADELDIPQHVLRFWETRFTQIKPMKRSGGRRYYRPDDVDLLRGIRRLLYGEGYTIRGVQRILREQGIKAVQGLADQAAAPPSVVGDRHHAAPEDDDDLPDQDIDDADSDEPGLNEQALDELDPDETGLEDDDDEEEETAASIPPQQRVATRPPANPFEGAARPEPTITVPRPGGAPQERAPGGQQGMSGADARKLRGALDELMACKRLIDDALKSAPAEMFPRK
ncbi:MerR family transcriptional regulator [Bradyrhizobium prioriisuperbiae]|uniref:MerR family transcriptional regulator n=1 Tax=Bradyrhizobium prioriisuperbiae TaxID=2854389 RepID=UPI0028E7E03B|nr:MerR family transcriptional regulator [Bradyrhizobium prioritasuperba]